MIKYPPGSYTQDEQGLTFDPVRTSQSIHGVYGKYVNLDLFYQATKTASCLKASNERSNGFKSYLRDKVPCPRALLPLSPLADWNWCPGLRVQYPRSHDSSLCVIKENQTIGNGWNPAIHESSYKSKHCLF